MLQKIYRNLSDHAGKLAFCIEDKKYNYKEFKEVISRIVHELKQKGINKNDIIAVIANNDIETYASILAIWFAGGTFVPINPKHPRERNFKIIEQVDIKLLISSNNQDNKLFGDNIPFLNSKNIKDEKVDFTFTDFGKDHILYIIFTSGSTGNPKGVMISNENLHSFFDSFLAFGYNLDNKDRFLQIYDLSFDASFHCYVLPLYVGAGIFTVNPKGIKYMEAFKLMQKHELTFAKMPPSTLSFLKPYFSSINLPKLKYSLFGGEALSVELVNEWRKCAPNAEIHNVYGPTELTINCLYYKCSHNIKSHNGIVSLGKPTSNLKAIIIDSELGVKNINEKGELCVAGNQVSKGYYKDESKNQLSFFLKEIDGKEERFYKTGDIAYFNENGDFFYCGRLDNQIQIQGYRVEIGEIENAAREIMKMENCIIVYEKNNDLIELTLVIEGAEIDTSFIKKELEKKIPQYMIPGRIFNIEQFIYNENGKIDRNKIKEKVLGKNE